MATVPELKAQAEGLGLKITSRMRKPEIEQAIKEEIASRSATGSEQGDRDYREALGADPLIRQAESASNKINEADPTPTPTVALTKSQRAALAGARGTYATPLGRQERASNYVRQNSAHSPAYLDKITPAQRRRIDQKAKRAMGRNERASLSMV